MRVYTKNFNGRDFDHEKSDYWPKGSIEEAYAWVLEKIPEAEKLPEQELKAFFKQLLLILKLSQNGYTQIAQYEIHYLTRSILEINTSIGKQGDLSNERKDQILGQIIRANMEWALVALNTLSISEKKRVQWTIGLIVKDWTEGNNLQKFV